MLLVKDDIPIDRAPLITLALIVASVAAGIAFGGGIVAWVAVLVLLWYAGPAVEDAMGRGPFFLFAGCAALVGVGVQLAIDAGDTIPLACAGALATALAAAHIRLYPWARVQGVALAPFFSTIVAVPLLAILAVWIVLQVLIGVLDWGDVAVGAQAAGFVFGFALGPLLARHVKTPGDLLRRGRAHPT